MALGNISTWSYMVPTLPTGQSGIGSRWPHLSIPITTPHGALSQIKMGSMGSPLGFTRPTKGAGSRIGGQSVLRNDEDPPQAPGLGGSHTTVQEGYTRAVVDATP